VDDVAVHESNRPKNESRDTSREERGAALWRAMRRFPFEEPEFRRPRTQRREARGVAAAAECVRRVWVMVGLLLVFSINLPQMAELERYRPSTTTELYDIHGKVVWLVCAGAARGGAYDDIPPVLREAILSIEDKNFEHNGGINLVRMVSAAYEDMHSDGKSQGASTLTMQLARNLFLSSEKTYGRKLQEIS
jgi:penicillin-binding protein 1A